jgi:hypothetical protein
MKHNTKVMEFRHNRNLGPIEHPAITRDMGTCSWLVPPKHHHNRLVHLDTQRDGNTTAVERPTGLLVLRIRSQQHEIISIQQHPQQAFAQTHPTLRGMLM